MRKWEKPNPVRMLVDCYNLRQVSMGAQNMSYQFLNVVSPKIPSAYKKHNIPLDRKFRRVLWWHCTLEGRTKMAKKEIEPEAMLDKHMSLRFAKKDWDDVIEMAAADEIPPALWLRIKIRGVIKNLRRRKCQKS
jgi:hypothetical protein